MTRDQFKRLAENWGGDIGRWPADSRDAARRLAGQDERAAALLQEQLDFDRLLAISPEVDSVRAGRAGVGVLQRLAVAEDRQPWYRRWFQSTSLLPVGSLVCSALIGIWMANALPYHQSEQALDAVSAVFDASAVTLWGGQ